jgi:hypothetical protein
MMSQRIFISNVYRKLKKVCRSFQSAWDPDQSCCFLFVLIEVYSLSCSSRITLFTFWYQDKKWRFSWDLTFSFHVLHPNTKGPLRRNLPSAWFQGIGIQVKIRFTVVIIHAWTAKQKAKKVHSRCRRNVKPTRFAFKSMLFSRGQIQTKSNRRYFLTMAK